MMNQPIYRKLIIGLALMIVAGCNNNEEVIPPPQQLSENAATLQQIIDDEVAAQKATFASFGMAVTLDSDQRGSWSGVGGVSHDDVAITSDMVFMAASITKTFIAALALQLQEEGALSLDDPISKWLTGVSVVDESATLRQLLNHTTGVFDYVNHENYIPSLLADPTKEWKAEEVIDALVGDSTFELGSSWGYSSTGFILAGMIISKATGNAITEELRNRFFSPLGFNNTFYSVETFPNPLVHIWDDPFGTGEFTDFIAQGLPLQAYHTIGAAPGSLISNSQDLSRWALLLYGGSVLTAESLKEMQTVNPQSFREDAEAKYGLGMWEFNINGQILYGHRGTKSHRSLLVYDPQSKISYAINSNRPDFDVFSFLEKLLAVPEIST